MPVVGMRFSGVLRVAVGGVLAGGLLAGCDAAAETPAPDDAAAALAAGLASGELEGIAFTDTQPDEAARQYEPLVEGMGGVEPSVEVAEVSDVDEDGSAPTAQATLAWSWPLGEQEWAYQADAALRYVDDEWQVAWTPTLVEPSLTGGEVLDASTLAAERADIVGAHGTALVTERPVVRVGIDRSQVPKARAGDSARQLAGLLGIDAASYVKRVEAAGDAQFVEAITYRREEFPDRVASQYEDIDGALALNDERALAATKEFAAPILGTIGEVTAEMVEEDPERYRPGDVAGLSGLQARYDEQLGGTPGVVVEAVKPSGKARELFREAAVDGEPLRLTLDQDLQLAAEDLLSDVPPASALVALQPSTGDLLVAANGPGTDGYNMATYGQFAPGSTFKSVSSLALLRAGLTPEATVPCTTSITVDGKRFENYDDYPSSALGQIPLRTAVANSCNTAFISQAGKVKEGDLADAAASLGLGVDHDLGFPSYFGQVPRAKSETEAAADLIGQGRILASPMVMAAVIASVQQGERVLPRLVTSYDVEPADVAPLTGREASALRSMLRGVVTSGSGSLLADVPGPPVIAKTGTAEFTADDGSLRTHAWMIAAQGDLAVAVFVEEGDSGSGTAGPILEQFLRDARTLR
ncbi:penicillin-binding transpeptidase domain-containing protein [Nocardioides taihuensis]|uniref:Penicillin-binding transpeptidase domain-containing protein n=1 Tax=Nocardioides taihuensis TaxID=1835606 RepID=A0ABW0BHB0_9ACTN